MAGALNPAFNQLGLTGQQGTALKSLVSVDGISKVVVLTAGALSAAASNAAAVQAALDQGGRVLLAGSAPGPCYIGSTLRIGSDTTLEVVGSTEIAASGLIGSLLTTKALVDAGTTVTISWSSGMTATVNWTGHGRSAGQFVWLNRADQGQFCGVFRIESITDANSFVVRLRRLPTTAATGTITARVAHQNITVIGGKWNYNTALGNVGASTNNSHAILLAGVYNLRVRDIEGALTDKYLVCLGAVSRYQVSGAGGQSLNSDVVKVYGPAFDGRLERIGAGQSGDDFLSFQSREPAAYAGFDFCHGDVLNASVSQLGGTTATGTCLLYASPYGVLDNITIDCANASQSGGFPQCRIETLWTASPSDVGTVTLSGLAAVDATSLVQLGNGSATLNIRSLVLLNPLLRSNASTRRLVDVQGSNVSATITVMGGYASSYDNLINCNNNAATVNFKLVGTRINGGWQAFRSGTVGTLNVILQGVDFESMPATAFSAPAGSSVITVQAAGVIAPTAPVISIGSGAALRVAGACSMTLDGTALDATVANHAAGASFYNSAAGFGAGVGAYVRGSTTWTRVAA